MLKMIICCVTNAVVFHSAAVPMGTFTIKTGQEAALSLLDECLKQVLLTPSVPRTALQSPDHQQPANQN